ncbi:MAG: saccharopine dehydrogenase NADP-binding domain-containing protein [Clostridia bacterium]|nr:saccharopine dehydrogenase NADP-binding domain-containing protein [Clostridia bacterium]
MDKVLVIGCNEITDVIVPILTGVGSPVKELCIAGKDKAQSDVYRKYATSGKTRIVTAAVDLSNEERTSMMLQIFGPHMIVYLGDAEYSQAAMKCALKVHAAYVDVNLFYNDIKDDFVAKQFEQFSAFRDAGLTAITGCEFSHAALIAMVKDALDYEYDIIDSIDVLEASSVKDNASKSNADLMEEIRKLSQIASVIEGGEVKQYAPFECKTSRDVEGIGHTDLFMFNHDIINIFLKEMPEIPNVRYFSTFNTHNLNLIKTLKNVGMLDTDLISVNGTMISPLDFLGLVLAKNSVEDTVEDNTVECDNDDSTDGVVNLVISGKKNGSKKISSYVLDCDKQYGTNINTKDCITGLVVATTIRFVMNGAWNKAGVFAPSRFDNRAFVESLKQDGLIIKISETEALRLIGDTETVSKLGNHSGAIETEDNSEVKVG